MARLADQSRPIRRTLGALALTVLCALSACASKPVTGGRYVEYPGQLELRTVLAAAESSLRARGYIIESTAATDDKGEIVARPPTEQDTGWFSAAIYVRARRDIDGPIRLTVARWPHDESDDVANTALRGIVETLGIEPLAVQYERRANAQTNAAER
jgi:hypothetical protein